MLNSPTDTPLITALANSVEGDDAARSRYCQQLFSTLFDSNPMAIMVTDRNNRIIAVNPGFSRLTGYGAEEAVGQTPSLLKSGRHDAVFYRAMWEALRDRGEWTGEIWDRRKDGSFYPKWAHIKVVPGRGEEGQPEGYVACFTDISAHQETENRIRAQAYHDALTGLPNRLLLRDRLEHALANAQRMKHTLAVLYIDLDNFKNINDSLGHAAGDQLLSAVAERLRASVRDMDTVARLGGDEFVVVLENLDDEAAAAAVAVKIHQSLAQPITVECQPLQAAASIGIALYPDDGDTADSLMRNADTAMYQAKARGRGNYQFFALYMNEQAREKISLENRLRNALVNNEFQLYYQPIIDLASGAMSGVEALLRWTSPLRGLITPEAFLPLAEETGAIIPIGDWTIRQVCRDLAAWEARGLTLPRVSVNISPRQFRQPNLARRIRAILQDARVAPRHLEIELTECALMDRPDVAAAILRELQAVGVSIAIDDFGTGYTSLGYLRAFPIDRLKIDVAFVRDLLGDQSGGEINRAVISLAHNLGLQVTAEGVEVQAQLDFLRQHGCDYVQGYYFSRPMPEPVFQTFMACWGRFNFDTPVRRLQAA